MTRVPSFFLYGEPPKASERGFLHLESLDVRSRPNGWTIRLHRHGELNHVFLMTRGGGVVRTGGPDLAFAAPCLLFIPAGAAHGFGFRQESRGQVLTVASAFLAERPSCRDAAAALFAAVRAIGCAPAAARLEHVFTELAAELSWAAPGHQAAVEALVLQVFVLVLRLVHQADTAEAGAGGLDAALVARFHEEVQLRLREHAPLGVYARALGVSLSRLHQACRVVARDTPLGIIQSRLLVEAKRGLLYSDASIAELAFDLGFSDPAYFSRFFARRAGVNARLFRASARCQSSP